MSWIASMAATVRRGVGLTEALGPLTKQKLLLARDAAFPQNGLIGRRFSHGLNPCQELIHQVIRIAHSYE